MKQVVTSHLEMQNRLEKSRISILEAQKNSTKWLNQRKMNSQKRSALRRKILGDVTREDSSITFGNMYMYEYNPEDRSKQEMKYYDTFPLVLPFDKYKSSHGQGFYGLNLHYLPPKVRALVLDEIRFGKKNNNIMIPLHNQIRNLAKNPLFEAAIHIYLYKNVLSGLSRVLPEEWIDVINLPLAVWKTHSKNGSRPHPNKVYADSVKRASKRNSTK